MLVTPVKAETDAGEIIVGTLTECVWCLDTKAEIEKRGEPMEIFDPNNPQKSS